MRTHMIHSLSRRRFALAVSACLVLTTACSEITSLKQENPGALSVETLYRPANAPLLVNGAIGDFECAFTRYVVGSGLFADELSPAIAAIANFDYDARRVNTNATYGTNNCSSPTPSASQLDWYNIAGEVLTGDAWNSPTERTLQYMAASTPEHEAFNRILLVINAREHDETVTLPRHEGVDAYTLLWDSSHDDLRDSVIEHAPGTSLFVPGASMQLMRAHGALVPRRTPRA